MRALAIWLGGMSWLPRFSPYIVKLDKLIQKLTFHRLTLLSFAGLPELYLSVAGRKSGIVRTTPLLCVPHEGGWLVAGSNWGQVKPPVWVGNLLAASEATVEYKAQTHAVEPHLAAGDERARLFDVMVETWPNYRKYAERTDREIPIFRLTSKS